MLTSATAIVCQHPKRERVSPQGYAIEIARAAQTDAVSTICDDLLASAIEETRIVDDKGASATSADWLNALSNVQIKIAEVKSRAMKEIKR